MFDLLTRFGRCPFARAVALTLTLVLACNPFRVAAAAAVSGDYPTSTTLSGALTFGDSDPDRIKVQGGQTLTLDSTAVVTYTRTSGSGVTMLQRLGGSGDPTLQNEGQWLHSGSQKGHIRNNGLFLNTGGNALFDVQAGAGDFDIKDGGNSRLVFENNAIFRHAAAENTTFLSTIEPCVVNDRIHSGSFA